MAKAPKTNERKPGSTRGKPAVASIPNEELTEHIKQMPLSNLHFDPDNPRFGGHKVAKKEERILDEIVRSYGVTDLLSSIASNGYLAAEPLVGVERPDGGIRIVEGNRRLAALLILADDPRSTNQSRLKVLYRSKQKTTSVPVVVYPEGTQPPRLLPYMGVKHIVGPTVWDSYAKVAWVDKVLSDPTSELTLESVEEMIGDTKGTIRKMLEGFYVMQQLEERGKYSPEHSRRKGRGSSSQYPFSWIYNALGYGAIREWLGISSDREPHKNPLGAEFIDRGAKLATYMFGNKEKQPVIAESREIGDLANCVNDHDKERRLDQGMMVGEVLRKTRPAAEQLREALDDGRDSLAEAWEALGIADLTEDQAEELQPLAKQVKKKASEVHLQIQKLAAGSEV